MIEKRLESDRKDNLLIIKDNEQKDRNNKDKGSEDNEQKDRNLITLKLEKDRIDNQMIDLRRS